AMTGCAKDYSYERQPQDSIPIIPIVNPSVLFSSCTLCNANNPLPDSAWSFKVDQVFFCGVAEKAIITLERSSFTFFGPSSCSADSGFIASVYLSQPLTSSKTNVVAARVAFYYYDRIAPSYVLISRTTDQFSLTIEAYDHQTGTATGKFEGFAFTENSVRKTVEGGKFRIRL
ncbi:MAG: hypothetical protein V4676_08455, partial [Bacteroidota bacterium]